MEEYLKKILATEKQAKKTEDDSQAKAEQIVDSANKKATELLAQAEEDAENRLAALRAEAKAEAENEIAKLEVQHTARIKASRERYQQLRETLISRISLNSETIPDLSKD
jgi:vacuolar-type H+-ATPase subunit H